MCKHKQLNKLSFGVTCCKKLGTYLCTAMVFRGAEKSSSIKLAMANKKKGRPERLQKCARASISFPPELYEALTKVAAANDVSVAWLVRKATEKFVNSDLEVQRELFPDRLVREAAHS